jgi:hypothetical protein
MYCGNSPLFAAKISCSNPVLNVHHYLNAALAAYYSIKNLSSSLINESNPELSPTCACAHLILQILAQIQLLQGCNDV